MLWQTNVRHSRTHTADSNRIAAGFPARSGRFVGGWCAPFAPSLIGEDSLRLSTVANALPNSGAYDRNERLSHDALCRSTFTM